jgi:hypothetical protein
MNLNNVGLHHSLVLANYTLGAHLLHASDTWIGIVYLQSMIMVRVSLSLASWNGACPHTSMYRITPKDHTSATDQNVHSDCKRDFQEI